MALHTLSTPRETEWQARGQLCLPMPGLCLAQVLGGCSPPGTSVGPCTRSAPNQHQLKKAEELNGICRNTQLSYMPYACCLRRVFKIFISASLNTDLHLKRIPLVLYL